MANRDRTEFASRVIAARKHAKLTQHALGAATGIKQSTISEMEVSGQSSLMTPQIARACGVDAYWLATGDGPMLGPGALNATEEGEQLAAALDVLSTALQHADKNALIAVERLLAAMAADPTTAKNKSELILRLLVTPGDKTSSSVQDELRRSHIFVRGERLDLGDANGRRDKSAAAGGERK
jgi:transcriptional regulator with XRE-family HTH domain